MFCEYHLSRVLSSALWRPGGADNGWVGEWLPAATGSGKNLELSLHGYELDLLVVRSIDSRRASGSDPYLQ